MTTTYLLAESASLNVLYRLEFNDKDLPAALLNVSRKENLKCLSATMIYRISEWHRLGWAAAVLFQFKCIFCYSKRKMDDTLQ